VPRDKVLTSNIWGRNVLYNVGGSITIPLDLFFGRQDRIKPGRHRLNSETEKTLMIEQRKIAITNYMQ
jgi:hypothetical protein